MKQIVPLFLLLLMQGSLHGHPLHLSVTNITLENGTVDISMKTFRDDWETAYFHYHSEPVDLTDPARRAEPWMTGYLNSRFAISSSEGTEPFKMEVDSITLEENAMTIRMHVSLPSEPNSLYIYNALLTDIYPDQTNLVIFGFKEKETGIKFDVKKHAAEVVMK